MCLKSFLLDKDVLGNWDFGKNVIHKKKGEISISTQDNEQPSHIKKKMNKMAISMKKYLLWIC